jgi:predicted RND superfamily exporter protein
MPGHRLDSLFAGVARFSIRRLRWIVLVTFALVGLSGWAAAHLEFQSSRASLVDPENAYQARLLRFFERFGHPEGPVFVIEGGSSEQRHLVVDALIVELEKEPLFAGRIFGRIRTLDIAESLFLRDPIAVAQAISQQGGLEPLTKALESGPIGLVSLARQGIEAALDEGNADVSETQANRNLEQLGATLRWLREAMVRGPDRALSEAGFFQTSGSDSHLDAAGYVQGEAGEFNVVAAFPEIWRADAQELESVVDAARRAQSRLRDAELPAEVSVLLTGSAALSVDEEALLAKGLRFTALASTVGIVLLLWFGLRSLRHAMLALVPLGLASCLGVGALWLLFGHVNLVTSSFLAVLLGLGIDFAVHLLARFQEAVRAGEKSPIEAGVCGSGPSVLTGTLTTVAAFLTLSGAEFSAYGEMGVITAVGLAIVFVATYLLVPGLLAQRWARGQSLAFVAFPGSSMAARLILRRPKSILVVACVGMLAGAWGAATLRYNPRYFDFLPTDIESSRALLRLESDRSMGPVFAQLSAESIEGAREIKGSLLAQRDGESLVASVQSASDGLVRLDAQSLEALRELGQLTVSAKHRAPDDLAQWARQETIALADSVDEVEHFARKNGRELKGVASLQQELKLLREILALPTAGGQLVELKQWSDLCLSRAARSASDVASRGRYALEDLPPLVRARYGARDGSGATAVYAYPARPIWDDAFAQRFAKHIETIEPEASGAALTLPRHNAMIVSDFERAAIMALFLIALFVWLDFRSVTRAALALLPVVCGWLWLLAAARMAGRSFDAANIVSLPLVLGIGVDAGVHMMHRVRESERFHGRAQMSDLRDGTGTAVLLSSLTTICGFFGLLFAQYGAMVSLGWMMVVGVSCTTLAALFVVPAILRVRGQIE